MKKIYSLSTFAIFGFFSIVTTFYFPYLNQQIGLSISELGKVVSVGALFTLVGQPLLTNFYTNSKSKKNFILTYLAFVFATIIFLMSINNKNALIYAPFHGIILGSLAGIFEIYIEEISTRSNYEFSDIRKWGSIGYGFIVFCGGLLITTLSYRYLHFVALFIIVLLMILIKLKFNDFKSEEKTKSNVNVIDLIENKKVVFLTIIIFLGMGSYMGLDFAYSPYLVSIIGDVDKANKIYSNSITFRVIIEFFSFLVVSKYINKINPKKALIFALSVASIRILMFSTGSIPLIVIGDQLHGVMYGIYLSFLFKYLREILEDKIVAISFALLSVLSSGGANFIYPNIYTKIENLFGYTSMYLFAFVLVIISIVLFIILLPKRLNNAK